MITQQLLRLIQQLALVLRTSRRIAPPHLYQSLCPCRLNHCFIHSSHGNPTSGTTYPSTTLSTPSRVTKLLAQFAQTRAVICKAFYVDSRREGTILTGSTLNRDKLERRTL